MAATLASPPGAMHEHEWRPFADALVSDLEPARPNDLHDRNLHLGRGQTDDYT